MKAVLLLVTASLLVLACESASTNTMCKPKAADVVFIMDNGFPTDIWLDGPMRQAIYSTVNTLAVSPASVHIGVLQASILWGKFDLELNKNTHKLATLFAINALPVDYKVAYLANAVTRARQMILRSTRKNAKRVVVLLTNRVCSAKALAAIQLLKRLPRTSIISVGISSAVKPSDLAKIATSKYNVIATKDKSISRAGLAILTKKICANIHPPVKNSGVPPINTLANVKSKQALVKHPCLGSDCLSKEICKPKAVDVVFIMDDGLQPFGYTLFRKMRSVMYWTVRRLAVSPSRVRIGVVRVANTKGGTLELKKSKNKFVALRSIQKLKYIKKKANLPAAVKQARRVLQRSTRKNVKRVIVLLTNRVWSSKRVAYTRGLRSLSRISVISVGMGSAAKPNVLARIATSKYNVIATKKKYIGSPGLNLVIRKTCVNIHRPIRPQLLWKVGACTSQQLDLVFIVDESGSVRLPNFLKMKEFVMKMVQEIGVSKAGTHVGLIEYSTSAKIEFELDTYNTTGDVVNSINSTRYRRGVTYTGKALNAANGVFNRSSRTNAVRLAVLLTDGKSTDKKAVPAAAANLKANGVRIVTIGIGSGVNHAELDIIASSEDDSLNATNFNTLLTSVKQIKEKLCEKKVRLVGGRTKCRGLVEVLYNGRWRKACDRGWTRGSAKVVCSQLGLSGGKSARTRSIRRKISMVGGVRCRGSESNVGACPWLHWKFVRLTRNKTTNKFMRMITYRAVLARSCRNVIVACGPGVNDDCAKP